MISVYSRRLFLLSLLALAVPLLTVQARQSPSGTLRGVVVLQGTSVPLRDVQITVGGPASPEPPDLSLLRNGRGGPVPEAVVQQVLNIPPADEAAGPQFSATTDSDGRFLIEGIPPGEYPVTARREGYFLSNRTGLRATVAPRQITEISLTLVPGGVLSGRIFDSGGKPVTNARIEVLRRAYRNGAPMLQAVGIEQSNDLGEYRIFRFPPGEYFLAVSAAQDVQLTRTFYPGVTESEAASPITLRPGEDLTGVDIQIQSTRTATISGRVVTELSVQTGDTATVTLLPRDPNSGVNPRSSPATRVALSSSGDGTFQFQNIPAGSYDLFASLPDTGGFGPGAPPGQAVQPVAYGRTSIDVRGDIRDAVVAVHQGVDVQGRLVVEGKPSGANVRIFLQDLDSSAALPVFQALERFTPAIGDDGSFVIPAVPEAAYRFRVEISEDQPAGTYVADIREGDASIYDTGIRVGASALRPIEVLLNRDGGTIEGSLSSTEEGPLTAGTSVVLVPSENRRQNPELYRVAEVDAQGTFVMEGVAPGSYTLFAWDSVPEGAYQNADFIRKYADRGVAITVAPNGRNFPTLSLISAEAFR